MNHFERPISAEKLPHCPESLIKNFPGVIVLHKTREPRKFLVHFRGGVGNVNRLLKIVPGQVIIKHLETDRSYFRPMSFARLLQEKFNWILKSFTQVFFR